MVDLAGGEDGGGTPGAPGEPGADGVGVWPLFLPFQPTDGAYAGFQGSLVVAPDAGTSVSVQLQNFPIDSVCVCHWSAVATQLSPGAVGVVAWTFGTALVWRAHDGSLYTDPGALSYQLTRTLNVPSFPFQMNDPPIFADWDPFDLGLSGMRRLTFQFMNGFETVGDVEGHAGIGNASLYFACSIAFLESPGTLPGPA